MFPLTNKNLDKEVRLRHLRLLKNNELVQQYTYDALVDTENLLFKILTTIPKQQAEEFIKGTNFDIDPYKESANGTSK